jgi:hypothetical protein
MRVTFGLVGGAAQGAEQFAKQSEISINPIVYLSQTRKRELFTA